MTVVQVTDLRAAQQLAESSNAETSADLASAVRHEMSEARHLTVALRQDLDAKEAVIKELTEVTVAKGRYRFRLFR